MYEKISDEEIRLEKVKKLKAKILSEIEKIIKVYKSGIQSNTNPELFTEQYLNW